MTEQETATPRGFGFFKNAMVMLTVAWIGIGAVAVIQPAYEAHGLVGALMAFSFGVAAMIFVAALAFGASEKRRTKQ